MSISSFSLALLLLATIGCVSCNNETYETSKGTTRFVSSDGRSGEYNNIQTAINSVPKNNQDPVTIFIRAGVHTEKITIDRPNITLQGENINLTRIQYNDNAGTIRKDTGNMMGTMDSATLKIVANNTVLRDLTVVNTALPAFPGSKDMQAVAVLVHADMVAFYRVKFLGFQDTLMDSVGRHYYYNSYIAGTVDFIAGNGRSLFKECTLASRATQQRHAVMTAQSRVSTDEKTGFSFVDCRIIRDPEEGSLGGKMQLGRPWRDAAFVLFFNTNIEDNVLDHEKPWERALVGGSGSVATAASFYHLQTKGPGGAKMSTLKEDESVPKPLTAEEIRFYTSVDFIDGQDWLKQDR